MALSGSWACPALAAGAPKRWPGASAPSPDPVSGEGFGVGLSDPVPDSVKRPSRPCPAGGGVSSHLTSTPLIPFPREGGA